MVLFTMMAMAEVAPHDLQYLTKTNQGSTRYIIYPSADLWIVDVYSEPSNRLPDRIDHRSFASLNEAKAFLPKKPAFLSEALRTKIAVTPEFFTEKKNAYIWQATNEWSKVWEDKFSLWLRTEVKEDFFLMHNIATDCADTAYALRWIFARINSLPAGNRLSGGKVLMTNETMKTEWEKLPTDLEWSKDRRFRAALKYLLHMTYTHTLFADGSPVAINPLTFREGIYYVSLMDSTGHTMVVNEVYVDRGYRLPIHILQSTVPQDVRRVDFQPLLYVSLNAKSDGFFRFRWVKNNQMIKKTDMYDYSEEQFSEEFSSNNGIIALYKRINPNFNPESQAKEGIKALLEMYQQRVNVVIAGAAYCQQNDCSPGTAAYENHSTPSRDKRLKHTTQSLNTFVRELRDMDPNISKLYFDGLRAAQVEVESLKYNLFFLSQISLADFLNSDPRTTVGKRWNISALEYNRRIKTEVDELLQKRQKVIVDNDCGKTNACEFGQPGYEKNQTFDLDGRIQQLLYGLESYCLYVEADLCKVQYENLQKLKIRYEANDLDVGEFTKLAVWMNSDPRWATAARKGELAKETPHFWISDAIRKSLVVGSHYLLFQGDQDIYLWDRNTSQLKALGINPQGMTDLSAHPTAPLIAWYDDGLMNVQNVETKNIETVQLNGSGSTFLGQFGWTTDLKLFVTNQLGGTQVYMVDLSTAKLTPWGTIPVPYVLPQRGLKPDRLGPIWMWKANDKIVYLNIKKPFVPILVNAPAECQQNEPRMVHSSEYAVLINCGDEKVQRAFSLELTSGVITALEKMSYVFVTGNWFVRGSGDFDDESPQQIVQLDQNYNLLKTFTEFKAVVRSNGQILPEIWQMGGRVIKFDNQQEPQFIYQAPADRILAIASEQEILLAQLSATVIGEIQFWLTDYSQSVQVNRDLLTPIFSSYGYFKSSRYFGYSGSKLRGEVFDIQRYKALPMLTGASMSIASAIAGSATPLQDLPMFGVESTAHDDLSTFAMRLFEPSVISDYGDGSSVFLVTPKLTLVLPSL